MSAGDILQKIAALPKGEKRAQLLKDEEIRKAVLNSGANVTLYSGRVKTAPTAKEALSDVYVGLIQRKNKTGGLDGLGALGGMAERTSAANFTAISELERVKLIGQKDDVILVGMHPTLTDDIDIIRKNNVLREMREELQDLGITDITINPEQLELIPMPKVKDDNYMINIWDGKGACYAVTPYCHIYEDKIGLIDEIVQRVDEQQGGEAVTYKKVPLFEALGAYGHVGDESCCLEDGRSADKDYRYPHEYLAAWGLAAKLMRYRPERIIALAAEVQQHNEHHISFAKLAKATGQRLNDVAQVLHLSLEDTQQIVQNNLLLFLQKSPQKTVKEDGLDR